MVVDGWDLPPQVPHTHQQSVRGRVGGHMGVLYVCRVSAETDRLMGL